MGGALFGGHGEPPLDTAPLDTAPTRGHPHSLPLGIGEARGGRVGADHGEDLRRGLTGDDDFIALYSTLQHFICIYPCIALLRQGCIRALKNFAEARSTVPPRLRDARLASRRLSCRPVSVDSCSPILRGPHRIGACSPAAWHVPHHIDLHTPTPIVVHTPHLLRPRRGRVAPPLFATPASESRTHTPYSGSYAGMRRVPPTINHQLCHSATYLLFLGRRRDGHLMRGSVLRLPCVPPSTPPCSRRQPCTPSLCKRLAGALPRRSSMVPGRTLAQKAPRDTRIGRFGGGRPQS
jgi:hypothetical protein